MPRPTQTSCPEFPESPVEVILVDDPFVPPASARASDPSSTPDLPANLANDAVAGEEIENDEGGLRLSAIVGSTPPWLVSSGVHLLIVLLLAVMTLKQMDDDKELFIAAGQVEEAEELEELTEILTESDMENMEELEVENMSFSAAQIDAGAMAFGDLSQMAEVSTDSVSEVTLADTTTVEIGDLFGKDGKGMTDVGDGLKAAATFFGQKAQGNRFAFVVDNSNSMGRGKFETALIEIVKTVRNLSSRQYFFVVFYSDTAYPLYYPEPAKGMVAATDANKRKLEYWLNTVQMCLQTRGEDAMKLALQQRPDVLFLLGDGAFTDRTGKILVTTPVPRVVMHTLGMQVKPSDAIQFAAIAKAHRGTYRDVGVTPAGTAMLNQMGPRPRNASRNGIWGIKLGDRKKKKKKKP